MYIKIDASDTNTGKVDGLLEYLEKENEGKSSEEREEFFNHENDSISFDEAKDMINKNTFRLSNDRIDKNGKFQKGDKKYYSLYISPSQSELAHIGNSKEKLKYFTHDVMDLYAKNFGKELTVDDLVYVAKIETERKMKGYDNAVRLGFAEKGDLKRGNQMHIHVVVSRRTKNNGGKISPSVTDRETTDVVVGNNKGKKGFNRKKWIIESELCFDKKFEYTRSKEDYFEYKLANKKPLSQTRIRANKTSLDQKIYASNIISGTFKNYDNKKDVEAILNQKGIKIKEKKTSLSFMYENNNVLNINTNSLKTSSVFKDLKDKISSFYPDLFKKAPLINAMSKELDRIEKEQEKEDEREI